jgi:hypothetical protein
VCKTVYEDKCQSLPEQQCKTAYRKQCEQEPVEDCKMTYRKECASHTKCHTTYDIKCKKPAYEPYKVRQ